jgi:hypothetical protein
MTMQRFYAGELTQISDDEVGVICGSDGVKRDGHEFVMRGIDTTNFMRNPVALCEHTPPPIGVFVRLGVLSAREDPDAHLRLHAAWQGSTANLHSHTRL